MSKLIYQYIFIFLMGVAGMWKAVPFGFVLKASPVTIFLMTAAGSMTSVLILYFFGKRIKKFFRRKKKPKKTSTTKKSRAKKLFEKYGIAGLGFFGTILIGPNQALILGIAIVKDQHKKLLYWVLASTIFWSFVLTLTGVYSIELIQKISESINIF